MLHVPRYAGRASSSIERVAVIKRWGAGEVPSMIEDNVVVMPIESPTRPAPAKTSEEADSEAGSK